VINIVFGKE